MAYLKMYGGQISSPGPTIVTWADGTDAEIAAMLEAHYAGLIDVTAIWNVGDERVVSLSAMSATGVGESHVAQDVTMVLMNVGGKTLTGGGTCAFIVGQKDLLAEIGYMNSTNINTGGWDSCQRRTWCNSVYKNALPSTLVGIFKEHINIAADGGGSTTAQSEDYFALASEKEVFGSMTYADDTAEANNTQFKYYETAANRIKKLGKDGLTTYNWWERSPRKTKTFFCICAIDGGGTPSGSNSTVAQGLAPFGVI